MTRPALIVLAAFALRALVAFGGDPLAPYDVGRSSDSAWYLANGCALVTGRQPASMVTDVARLASPPLYFLFVGVPQAIMPPSAAVAALWLAQAGMGAAICGLAYAMARRLSGNARAAALIGWALAVHPALIVESGQILTETLFMFLLTAGTALLLDIDQRRQQAGLRPHAAGVVFALAALTRAVALPLPVALAGWWALRRRLRGRAALALLAVYIVGVGTWTAYSAVRWGRFVIAGEGLGAFVYLGAAGWDDPAAVDAALAQAGALHDGERDFAAAAAQTIGADPLGYLQRRVGELAGAYLQPHGTAFFAGDSLRALLADWWRADRTPAGLWALTAGDSFWIKLALYVVHYMGLMLGAAGCLCALRRPQQRDAALLLALIIGYFTAAHLVLLALPRYLFPTTIFWWVLAACTFSASNLRATKPPPPS